MSQELMYKIEEKLGGIIDIMTFDNAQQVVDYLSKYIQLSNLISTLTAGVICIICIVIALTAYKIFEEHIGNYSYRDICIVALIIGIISATLFILFLSDTIIAYNFPIATVIKWLK